MFRQKYISAALLAALVLPTVVFGQAASSSEATAKIKDEGMNRSQAMATIRYLTDVIGARLTNSPNQRRANRWTKEQLEKWGLKNAAIDPWGEFGRGWELKRFSASVSTPEEFVAFRSYPKAWSPSTNGPITGDVVYVDATDEAGLEKYWGRIRLSKPRTTAVSLLTTLNPFKDVYGINSHVWTRNSRFGPTYGAYGGYHSNFDGKSRVAIGPTLGYRMLGVHLVLGYNFLLGDKTLEGVNSYYGTLRFYVPLKKNIDFKK